MCSSAIYVPWIHGYLKISILDDLSICLAAIKPRQFTQSPSPHRERDPAVAHTARATLVQSRLAEPQAYLLALPAIEF